MSSFSDEKRRIARAAAALVRNGDTVALSGGTTTTEVMRSLKVVKGITIITNTVNVAMELSNHKDIEVGCDWWESARELVHSCGATRHTSCRNAFCRHNVHRSRWNQR